MRQRMLAAFLLVGISLSQVAGLALAQERPAVVAVNYPLAYFAERLGGDEIDVLFDVPADRDPAFWRPSLAAIAEFQAADLIALNGAGFAAWTTKVSLPRSRLVDTSAGFSDKFISTQSITHSHGADGEHSHTGTASYTWLDFQQAAAQAEALAEAMKRRLPDLEQIDTNLDALSADLDSLAQLAEQAAEGLRLQGVIATHPRYQYFARAYDLTIEALEWPAGVMPSDAQWAELERHLESRAASVLLWEAEPPEDAVARARAMGLTSVVLSPLANRPAKGDFISQMSIALEKIVSATTRD